MFGSALNSVSKKKKNVDKLDLSGILNCFDGIVDTPDRMIIMTTNFPGNLDEALTRPGRIDIVVELGYVIASQMIEMLEHFFSCSLNRMQISQIEAVLGGVTKFSPAEIEQMCSQFPTVDLLWKI